MLLVLVRHALADVRDDTKYPDDAERPLVDKGRKIQRTVSRRLRRAGIVPKVILASPWKRAWQTAGILAQETGVGKKVRVPCPPLARDPDLEQIAQAVGPRHRNDIIALVGHEPWMSELASLLLTGSPNRAAIDYPKSGVMGIEVTSLGAGSGTLRFFLTPKL